LIVTYAFNYFPRLFFISFSIYCVLNVHISLRGALANALGSQSQAWIKKEGRVGRMGADTTAIKKKDEKNPMNMTTTVGNFRVGKGDRW